jgi:hypothetical protein
MENDFITETYKNDLNYLGYNGPISIYDIFLWFIIEKKLYPEIILWSSKKNTWLYRITNEYGHIVKSTNQSNYDYNSANLMCLKSLIELSKR